MGHKAGASFFKVKRPWSKRKDLILRYYLKPYLQMVAALEQAILLVDAFAGPGEFEDGNPGSPRIICELAKEANGKPLRVPVRVLAIEADEDFYQLLHERLKDYDFAETRLSKFLDAIDEIESRAVTHTVFLYVDPWTVEGLEWDALARIFSLLRTGRSVEIFMNFNASSFVRRGLAALKLAAPEETFDEETDEPLPESPPSIATLDQVVGGDWWQERLRNTSGFPTQVEVIADGYCDKLREHFKEVCVHSLKAQPHYQVPKYYLLFGSRTAGGLRLMNDAMVKSREMFAEAASPAEPTLFETRSVALVPDNTVVPAIVLEHLTHATPRGDLISSVMRSHLGVYSQTTIRRTVTDLIKQKRIISETGKARIKDTVRVWRSVSQHESSTDQSGG